MATLEAASSTAGDDKQILVVTSRSDLRAWLAANHERGSGLWLVRSDPGRPDFVLGYDDLVEEALCFGWIDSQVKKLPDGRTVLWYSPRRKGSIWSRLNKVRVDHLASSGLIEPSGWAAINRAKEDGTWTLLDSVEDLVVPEDLADAFEATPLARTGYDAMPPSARKTYLASVVMAKTEATRRRRVERVISRCERGLRP